ncbi:hypothetical protein F2P79_008107 [Pimephales promelas]|nr:hypothetical protein F2P79_008107 [Pimephales promelas]
MHAKSRGDTEEPHGPLMRSWKLRGSDYTQRNCKMSRISDCVWICSNLTDTAGSRKTPAPFLQNEDFSAVVYIPSTTCMLLMGGGHSGKWHLSWISYKEILNEG